MPALNMTLDQLLAVMLLLGLTVGVGCTAILFAVTDDFDDRHPNA